MGALALPWAVDPAQAAGGTRPNLLFVLVDQWRFCSFSHGEVNDAVVQTPNLDQFVGEGLRWRKAYAISPLCTPERAVLMTGRYPHQTGMTHNNLMIPPGNRCLAEVFAEAGYATHYIGKTHFDGGAQPGFIPHGWRRRGFTSYQGFNRNHVYMPTSEDAVRTFDDDGRQMVEAVNRYEPEFQTDLAIDFIDQNRTRPWFCFVSWGPPHTPYADVPAKYKTYTVTSGDLRPNVPETASPEGSLANYFAQCTALDDNFGRLMQFLEEKGLKDNTLVVFTSDHGDMLRSHDLTYKSKPEEESCHIPLFMRMPGTVASSYVSDTPIGGVDMMPTLLSLCGLARQKTCAGVDKSTAAKGLPMPEIDSIYCEYQTDWRMVRTDQYKLVVRQDIDTAPIGTMTIDDVSDLFDMDADPYELNNLVAESSHAAIKQQLYDRLVQWIADTGDTWPATPPKAKGMYTT